MQARRHSFTASFEVEGEHPGKIRLDASTRRMPAQPVMLRHGLLFIKLLPRYRAIVQLMSGWS
jgi:hypothetical protein